MIEKLEPTTGHFCLECSKKSQTPIGGNLSWCPSCNMFKATLIRYISLKEVLEEVQIEK